MTNTASFLAINGLNVDAYYDSFQRQYTDIQQFDRNEGLNYEGSIYATKREWHFEMPWESNQSKAIGIRDWVKGRGHYWTFQRVDGATTRFNKFSAEGGPGFNTSITAGTTRFPQSQGGYSTWGALVNNGDASTVTVTFGNEGRYSMSLWKLDSGATWVLCSAVYDGSTLAFYAGTALTTAFAWVAVVSNASGYFYVQLQGKNQGGTAATAAYDKLWIVPYALTTPMLAARNARNPTDPLEPVFPFVEASGQFVEDLFPITVKAFVDDEQMKQVAQNGTQNARLMKLHLVEK